ncbi:unnamed protein product [Hermetia illucens]|uniref:Uncharacterized protein n=2 Tax=Hermetia illucens TaxID=343691 RepID=A0A7R8U9U8_HERIL|nr:unnamed protein product [Hermetia illucens]
MLKATQMLNDTNNRITTQLQHFNIHLNECIQRINEFKKWYVAVDKNKIHVHFLNTYQQALNFLNEALAKYDCLWRIVSNQASIWECSHITEVVTTLNHTMRLLPPSLQINHQPNAATQTSYDQQKITIQGYLPIFDVHHYDLIQASAIPQRLNNNLFVIPEIHEGILGLNYDEQLYFEISREELDNSFALNTTSYMIQLRALYNIQMHPNCLITQVYNSYEGKNCSTQHFQMHSIILKKLYTPNTWIYATPSPTVAYALCNGQRSEIVLKEEGIIQLTSDCSLTTKEIILLSEQRDLSTNLKVYFKPFAANINSSVAIETVPILNGSTLLEATGSFSTIVQEAYKNQELSKNMAWKKLHSHAFNFPINLIIVIGLTSIFILILIRKNIQSFCKTQQSSQTQEPNWYDPTPAANNETSI